MQSRVTWRQLGRWGLIGGAVLATVPSWATNEGGEAGLPTTYALNSTAGEPTYDASAQIAAYADLVHASYAAAATAAASLRSAIQAFLDAPTEESLAAARQAWLDARTPYLQTETFRFYDGPVEAIEGRINAWPLNEAFIDYVDGDPAAGLVNASATAINLGSILVNDQMTDEADVTTGWHAIEFLLWGQDHSDTGPGARPASDYTPGQGNNDRRRAYLAIVADLLAADLADLAEIWAPDGNSPYRAIFTALPKQEALGRIINGMAILAGFEMMGERLAVALETGSQEDEHSCFSDNTWADFVYDIQGVRNVYFGDYGDIAGPGLDELAAAVDPALNERMTQLLDDAQAALEALDQPFDTGVLAQPMGSPARQEAEAAVTALDALGQGLVELGTKLGVLVLIPG